MKEKETILDKLTKLITLVGSAILMNLLFLVSCLPIITIGQAWAGLLSAVRYNIRGDSWFQGYKVGFKTRFFRGTIAWCVMLVVIAVFFGEVNKGISEGFLKAGFNSAYLVPTIFSSLILAVMAMMGMALTVLNVYIPTKAGEWVSNASRMVFRCPLQLLIAAALFWAPVVVGLLVDVIYLYFVALILVAVYYLLVALGCTMLLKEPLLDFLLDARADGTLLAEEGKQHVAEAEEESDDADEEDE